MSPLPAGTAWASARRLLGWIAVGWTLVTGIAAAMVAHYAGREHIQVARIRAEEACRAEFTFHLINAQLGGLYESVSPELTPDPLLTKVAERDLTTVSGQKLTLVNPGRVLSFARPKAAAPGAEAVHLTSLRPFDPGDAADAWETNALQRLAGNRRDVVEEVSMNGRPMLRYLSALTTQACCLKCHGEQGFQAGDVCGAVSAAVPLEFSRGAVLRHERATTASLAGLWMLGLVGLFRSGQLIRHRLQEREATHTQLEDSECRFRILAAQAPVGIYETDSSGQFTYVNRHWCDMTGLTPATASKKNWAMALHPEDREAVSQAWLAHVHTGQDWQRDYRCVSPQGKVFRIHDSAVALRDATGRVTGHLGVAADVTELLHASEALRGSEERFRHVFEMAPLGVVLLDVAGHFVQLNRTFAQMLGYEPGELNQRTMADITHPDDLARSEEFLCQSRANPRQPFQIEKRYVRKDGFLAWGTVTTVFLLRSDGQPLGHLAMVLDTTERHRSDAKLREQAALLDISQDAICVQSLKGEIEFWNPAAEKLYGWSRAEALGANSADLLFGRVSRELLQAQTDVLTHGSWSGELQQTARDGRPIHVQTRFSLVRDAQDNPKSILVVSTDITEKKRMEREFLRAQRLECVGALASGVAHDLNNVFSPILMVSELLACRAPDPTDTELLTLLRTSADRGSSIVRQLLTFSRGQEAERTELRVEHLLKEMHRLASETFPKHIQFTTRPEPDLWSVIGDVTQIHQVLLNLTVNARDAMPAGGSLSLVARNFRADAVFCQMKPEVQPGPYVLLEVTDTGTGIPPEIQDKIFDPFFTTKPPGQGTGLGLPTVLSIVKGHRGFMDLQSRPGQGTRFRVFLPAIEHGAAENSLVPHPAVSSGHGELVLVVDDEEAICLTTKHLLAQHGYAPLVARDGVEAIVLFTRYQAGLRFVLTDMMMPGMDGISFIRAVRKLAPDVPIIAMSGMSPEHFAADLASQSHVTFLAKPFTGEALVQALQDFPQPEPAPPAATNTPSCDTDSEQRSS